MSGLSHLYREDRVGFLHLPSAYAPTWVSGGVWVFFAIFVIVVEWLLLAASGMFVPLYRGVESRSYTITVTLWVLRADLGTYLYAITLSKNTNFFYNYYENFDWWPRDALADFLQCITWAIVFYKLNISKRAINSRNIFDTSSLHCFLPVSNAEIADKWKNCNTHYLRKICYCHLFKWTDRICLLSWWCGIEYACIYM